MIEARWFGFARYHRLPSVSCANCDFARRVGGAGEICAMHEWLCTLAHNLAVGAALCASFEMGRDAGPDGHVPFKTSWWRPGCGKPWSWPHITRDDRSAP